MENQPITGTDSPFYLNVVGYKVDRLRWYWYSVAMFYLNVVGYKDGLPHFAAQEQDVLFERSGI